MKDETIRYKLAGALNTTISAKFIYMLICEFAGQDGKLQIPISDISRTLKIGKNTIRRCLHRLKDKGYLDIKSTFHDDGGRAPNIYFIK